MLCREMDYAGFCLGLDPNRPSAANQTKRIFADDFARTINGEAHHAGGELLRVAKLISHTQKNTGHVAAIAHQGSVVRFKREFRVDAFARITFGDGEFAAYIAFNPQIAPGVERQIAKVDHEGRVFQMGVSFAIGIGFGMERAINIEL